MLSNLTIEEDILIEEAETRVEDILRDLERKTGKKIYGFRITADEYGSPIVLIQLSS